MLLGKKPQSHKTTKLHDNHLHAKSQKGRERTILHTHSPQLESHLFQPCPYSHSSFHQESPARTSLYLPAVPSRDLERQCSAASSPHHQRSGPRLAAPLPPPRAICLSRRRVALLTRLRQGHPSPLADGVTELSCRSGESICQEIMIMNHPFTTHAACFPFHTLGSMMDSKRRTFS